MSRTAFISSNAEIYRRLKNLEEKVEELQPIEPEEEDLPEGNKYLYNPLDKYREYAPMSYDEDIHQYRLSLDKDEIYSIEHIVDESVGLLQSLKEPIQDGDKKRTFQFLGYDCKNNGITYKKTFEGETESKIADLKVLSPMYVIILKIHQVIYI